MSTLFLDRRRVLLAAASAVFLPASALAAAKDAYASSPYRRFSDAEWRRRLPPASYRVLRHEDTERPGTSPLNKEKRKGTFVCLGCDLPLLDRKSTRLNSSH